MAQEQAKSESAAAGAKKAENPLEAMTRQREEKSSDGPLERTPSQANVLGGTAQGRAA